MRFTTRPFDGLRVGSKGPVLHYRFHHQSHIVQHPLVRDFGNGCGDAEHEAKLRVALGEFCGQAIEFGFEDGGFQPPSDPVSIVGAFVISFRGQKKEENRCFSRGERTFGGCGVHDSAFSGLDPSLFFEEPVEILFAAQRESSRRGDACGCRGERFVLGRAHGFEEQKAPEGA